MTLKTRCLSVLLCFLGMFACYAEAYTYVDSKEQERRDATEQDDPYLRNLLARFPEHKKILDKIYNSYSGWVIELSEKYGEAPLLAMSEAKEDEYIALFRNPEVFDELYQTMTSVKSKPKRAYLALRLANAMLLTDPERDYTTELERAKEEDRVASRNGKPSHRYMDAFFAKSLFPDNLLSELKKSPEQYAILLDALSGADALVLESIAKYPNALAFLLNAGPGGIKLIEETNGEIVTLSYIMTNEAQARLPALFKEYRLLGEALASCGAEAFFVITAAPRFYFALASSFSGEVSNRYFVAYAILSSFFVDKDDNASKVACDFLNNLSREETLRIARLTAEFMIKSKDDDGALSMVAPFFDPWYIQFVHKYDRAAIDVCAEYGDIVTVGTLLMEDWKGRSRDVSPVIEAILDYDDGAVGLWAAMMFRYNDHMQGVILDPSLSSRHKELLMFLFYDSVMDLSANMSDWEKISQKLLDDYRAESRTGKPIPIDGTPFRFREFVPGYDVVKPVYDWAQYGKTPTLGDLAFAAFDLVEVVPVAVGLTTLAKEVGEHGLKRIPGYLSKTGVAQNLKQLTNIPSILKGTIDDTLDTARKLFRQQVDDVMGAMGNLSKLDVWAAISTLRPDMGTLSDLWGSARKFATGMTSNVVGIVKYGIRELDDLRKLYPQLRGNPWMVKHATEAVVNGLVVESVLQPALFYTGALSIYNYIESRQFPVNIEE